MAYSFENLKSLLWAGPGTHVYAFVRGEVITNIRQRLISATVNDWDCLLRGALSEEEQSRAPYVVDLLRESLFTDWLLSEAEKTYPEWGFLGISDTSFLSVRELGRVLMKVKLPGGQHLAWNWVHPQLWFGLLPQLDEQQLLSAFAEMSDWVEVNAQQWRWFTLSAGQISVAARDCLSEA